MLAHSSGSGWRFARHSGDRENTRPPASRRRLVRAFAYVGWSARPPAAHASRHAPRSNATVAVRAFTGKFVCVTHSVFDVDPEFSNTEEWLAAIPEPIRPRRDQPFYRLLAENAESHYEAYVSEQNLVADDSGDPIEHPQIDELFEESADGAYKLRPEALN
ncbi:MAG: heat shock protein HspQ [Hyphomonadaceae bacterium]|nr:heat shock protein HspQ [Hyphomonadaceae bacterium]